MSLELNVDKFLCGTCKKPFFIMEGETLTDCPHCGANIDDYSDEHSTSVVEDASISYMISCDPFNGIPFVQTFTDFWDEDVELTTKPILERKRYAKSDTSNHTFLTFDTSYRSYAIFGAHLKDIMGYTTAPQDVWEEEPDALLIPITKEEYENATREQ